MPTKNGLPPAEQEATFSGARQLSRAFQGGVWFGGPIHYAGKTFRGPIDDSGSAFNADLDEDDTVVLCKTATNGGTFTLDGSVADKGRVVTVIDADGSAATNAITIDSDGSSSINGDSNISTNNLARSWVYDGSDWFEIFES